MGLGTLKKIVTSSVYTHPVLGPVKISVRPSARHIIFRWRDKVLHATVPESTTLEYYEKVLEDSVARLLELRPSDTRFYDGMTLRLDGYAFTFGLRPLSPDYLSLTYTASECTIVGGRGFDYSSPTAPTDITNMMLKVAAKVAPAILDPIVRSEIGRTGAHPASVKYIRGTRKLGHCDSRRNVAISTACLFLPDELRRYIVCHELAHLTEMNHSPRFHALCDRYLGGNERRLIAALRSYRWPIVV